MRGGKSARLQGENVFGTFLGGERPKADCKMTGWAKFLFSPVSPFDF
jgi:hypothetical protein